MHDRVKKAFDKIHAEEELKKRTKEFLSQKTPGSQKDTPSAYRRLAVAMACFLLVLAGGYSIYFTPESVISVDVNPSIELGVNRFDRVISAASYNEEGCIITSSLNVRFRDYRDALDCVLTDESMARYLTQDDFIAITVFGAAEERREEMISNLTARTAVYENVYCSSGDSGEVTAAHSAGLSCGKYKAFLELQSLNPDITPDDVKGLTMRQIRNMIDVLSNGMEEAPDEAVTQWDNHLDTMNGYGHGNGNGYRYGQRR